MASSTCVVTESESHRIAGPDRVITELNRGREIAGRLRRMLRESGFDGSADSVLPAQSLVTQLLDTFTHSLSMLRDSAAESDEVSQLPSVAAVKSEDSGDSCKTPAAKDRRGCYKRKRSSDTWTKETPNLLEDGHAWRKYGQKAILNAKHPRNYFRCTHKFDQGCQASKQVQKVEDSPPLFRTTYLGQHTCKNLFKSAHHHHLIMQEDPAPPESSIIWSFDSTTGGGAAVKQEVKGDYYMNLPDLTVAFDDRSDLGEGMSSDVYSCTAASTPSPSIGDMDALVNFDNFWN